MPPDREYIRLPGRRRVTLGFTRNSLWLGKDHLLHVINRGYTEDYRRFYYRDIQAILVRRTQTSRIVNTILGFIVGFNVLLLIAGRFVWAWESYVLIPLAVATLFWIAIFGFQLAAGPTCVCHLRTAVQFEQLPSLFRVRTAKKAIALLRHRIETVQGNSLTNAPSGP